MTKKILLPLVGLLCLGACKSPAPQTAQEIVTIDIDEALAAAPKELRLSDFVDSVSFVPIYSGDGISPGGARVMGVTENYIFICDDGDRLMRYDRNGRGGVLFGAKGSGPQEYLHIESLAADELSNVVYALVRNDPRATASVFKYDLEGRFLDSFPLPGDADNIGLTTDGHLAIHMTNYTGRAEYQYLVMDGAGEIVTLYSNGHEYRTPGNGPFIGESAKYSYEGELHMKDKSDTLYVFRGTERHPKYVFKNVWSLDGWDVLSQMDYDRAFTPDNMFETATGLVYSGTIGGFEERHRCLFHFDKTTGLARLISGDIPNDVTGHPEYFRQTPADATSGNCYVQIVANPHRATDPSVEEAPCFLMLLHLK